MIKLGQMVLKGVNWVHNPNICVHSCTIYTYMHYQIPPICKIYPVSLPSVLYETLGHNERSVLNQVFLLLFSEKCSLMKSAVLFSEKRNSMKSAMLFSEKHNSMKSTVLFTEKCNEKHNSMKSTAFH